MAERDSIAPYIRRYGGCCAMNRETGDVDFDLRKMDVA